MNQSASLYRISQGTFNKLYELGNAASFTLSMAKSSALFQGSFMGLEFILSKDKDSATITLINQIFSPDQTLGGGDCGDLTSMDEMKFYDDYEKGKIISYVDKATVVKINTILEEISEKNISLIYNSDELNNNGIYPEAWHDDNSANMAFNKRQILEGFSELKLIYRQAADEQDYILVYIG